MPTLKGTEMSLSCVQCFLYLVSSSINVSVFHIAWPHGCILSGQTIYVCIHTHMLFYDVHGQTVHITIWFMYS